jgi:hypothetical protein
MRTKEAFDCLRMKREIQAKLHKKWAGLSTAEIEAAIEHDLATSQTEVARWWRRLVAAQISQKRP